MNRCGCGVEQVRTWQGELYFVGGIKGNIHFPCATFELVHENCWDIQDIMMYVDRNRVWCVK